MGGRAGGRVRGWEGGKGGGGREGTLIMGYCQDHQLVLEIE